MLTTITPPRLIHSSFNFSTSPRLRHPLVRSTLKLFRRGFFRGETDDIGRGIVDASKGIERPKKRSRILKRDNTIICDLFANIEDLPPLKHSEIENSFVDDPKSDLYPSVGRPTPRSDLVNPSCSTANKSFRTDATDFDTTLNDSKSEQENEDPQNVTKSPMYDFINGDTYVRVGNMLLLAPPTPSCPTRNLKRRWSSSLDHDNAPWSDVERFSTPEDDLCRPRVYRRLRRLAVERRFTEVEDELVEPLHDVLKSEEGLFAVQDRPNDVRISYLGRDGLDDSPTPPTTP